MKDFILILFILGIGKITFAQSYLPLTGGTLTGPLTGTTAVFSSSPDMTFPNNPSIMILLGTDTQAANKGSGILFGGAYTGTTQTTFGYVGAVKENGTDSNYAGRLVFGTRAHASGGAEMTRMVITSTGNVGIGTTSPAEKLSVNGKVRAHEVKVETANWPDYVFKKDYVLRPLSEVKKFITVNHHLPEIPSALAVEKEGLNLGEMNTKLLRKIEELTLYLIELDETVQQQKSEISDLKSKL